MSSACYDGGVHVVGRDRQAMAGEGVTNWQSRCSPLPPPAPSPGAPHLIFSSLPAAHKSFNIKKNVHSVIGRAILCLIESVVLSNRGRFTGWQQAKLYPTPPNSPNFGGQLQILTFELFAFTHTVLVENFTLRE